MKKKTYSVQLTLDICAESEEAAKEIVIGAAEHLIDTYNDDDSILSLVYVKCLGQKKVI